MRVIYYLLYIAHRVLRKGSKEYKRMAALKKYDINPSVNFWETTTITGNGKISIAAGTYIGQHSFISSQAGSSISIGRNCKISHNVHIRTLSYDSSTLADAEPQYLSGDIRIGDNCWIGVNTYIRGGVSIGDNCVIGANSVVLNAIPENTVAGGCPARPIKRLPAQQ